MAIKPLQDHVYTVRIPKIHSSEKLLRFSSKPMKHANGFFKKRQKMKLCLKGKNKIRKFNDEAGTVRVNSGPGTLGSVVEELRQTDL